VLPSYPRFYTVFLLAMLVGSGCFVVQAQEKDATSGGSKAGSSAQAQADGQQDPLKRPRKKDDKAANIEKLGGVYKKWLDEDVRWIITDEELSAFKKLANNAERDVFIEGFWQRRDPTPDTAENEYKEEHYRRLAYVNTNFAAGVPGWKTDRGRFYITYGPPSRVEHHLRAVESDRPLPLSDNDARRFDRVVWHWDYVEGIGEDVTLKFVDTCGCGEYHLPVEPNDLRRYTPK